MFFYIILKNRFKKLFLKNRSIVIANKTLQNCVKQGSVYFLLSPKQGPKTEGVVLHRVCIFFCPKQGQGLKPSAAPLYSTMGQVPPPTGALRLLLLTLYCLEVFLSLIILRAFLKIGILKL